MPKVLLPTNSIRHLSGFGQSEFADGYVYSPTSVGEVEQVFCQARKAGRKVVLRGAGMSYGDAAIAAEQVVLDLSRLNKVLSWDSTTGVIKVEGGVTLEEIWRKTLPDGWWLPVVSGTMKPTIGGALAMNIHGKNNWMRGTLGEHVQELTVTFPNGDERVLTPNDELFYAVISGAGLIGAIVKVSLQMKKVASGDLKVEAVSCPSWDEQFRAFERFEGEAEYVVSWIDCFACGANEGRGILHAAWHVKETDPASLLQSHQDLPLKIAGVVPKSTVWRFLKVLNHRFGMRQINALKHMAGKRLEHGKTVRQSLAKFNFLLDYVPGWERAYLPGGLIQCQFFIPKEHARRVFSELIQLQQEASLESFLAVMKRHRSDKFLLSHGVDGYSLALDFKVTQGNRESLWALAHEMNDLALRSGGRFYFAKDSTLTEEQGRQYLGSSFEKFVELKNLYDPEGLLTSQLAQRIGFTHSP